MALNGIPISEDQCIGDSLSIINGAFQNLDTEISNLTISSSGCCSTVNGLSSNWESSYMSVAGLSANWQSTYTTVYSNSAAWGSGGGGGGGGGSVSPTPIKTVNTFSGSTNMMLVSGYTNNTAINYSVYLDGVKQIPDTDYSVSSAGGGRIVFATNPSAGVVADVTAWQTTPGAVVPSSVSVTYTDLTGTGSQSIFAINGYASTLPEKYLVHVGGLYQRPGINYTVAAGNITFTTPPPNESAVCVLALQ